MTGEKRGGSQFSFNIDQRKPPSGNAKRWGLALLAIVLALGIGGAAAYGREAAKDDVKSDDQVVERGKSITDYHLKHTITIRATASEEWTTKKWGRMEVTQHDPRLEARGSYTNPDTITAHPSCDRQTGRTLRSEWWVHYPDRTQSQNLAADVCFAYSDTVTTSLVLRHSQHGYGDYRVRGILYNEEVSLCWTFQCSKTTAVQYEHVVAVKENNLGRWL